MQITQYPRSADGMPLDLMAAVITDPSGNSGMRVVSPVGPDGARIDTVSLIPLDRYGNYVDLTPIVTTTSAVGDGVTDDTIAIQSMIDLVSAAGGGAVQLYAKTYLVSQIVMRSNVHLRTMGLQTRLKQKAGTPVGTPIVHIHAVRNVKIDDFTGEGNIATDTGEWNAVVEVSLESTDTANTEDIQLGNIHGINIRGDVLYIGSNATAYAAGYRVRRIRYGVITGYNILRNVVSVTGGWDIEGETAESTGGGNGLMTYDVEPDVGNGGIVGVRIGTVRGQHAAVVAAVAADAIEGAEIGLVHLTPTVAGGNSTPPYSAYSAVADIGFQMRNCKNLKIDTFEASGFNAQAIKQVYSGGELGSQGLTIDHCDVSDCAKTDVTYHAFISCAKDVTKLSINRLKATSTVASTRIVLSTSFADIGHAEITNFDTSCAALYDCDDGTIRSAKVTNGIALSASARTTFLQLTTSNSDRILSFCTHCKVLGGTLVTTVGTNVNVGTGPNHFITCTINGTYWNHLCLNSSNTQYFTDSSNNISNANTSGAYIATNTEYRVNGLKVIGVRKTGWGLDTGTAKRTANATYVPGATLTFSAAYAQAELDAMATRMAAVEAALRDATQTIKAIKDDVHSGGGGNHALFTN